MAWARIDDKLHKHSKFANPSLAAIGLWTLCMSYCNDELTDGWIPDAVVAGYAGSDAERLAGELSAIAPRQRNPLWHKCDGGYRVHDFHEYNQSRDQVLSQRSETKMSRADAGRIGGIRSGETRRSKQIEADEAKPFTSDASSKPKQTEAKGSPVPVPVPVPVPERGYDDGARAPSASAVTELPHDFAPSAAAAAAIAQSCPLVDQEYQTGEFRVYYSSGRGAGLMFPDWQAKWKSWMTRAKKEYGDGQNQLGANGSALTRAGTTAAPALPSSRSRMDEKERRIRFPTREEAREDLDKSIADLSAMLLDTGAKNGNRTNPARR